MVLSSFVGTLNFKIVYSCLVYIAIRKLINVLSRDKVVLFWITKRDTKMNQKIKNYSISKWTLVNKSPYYKKLPKAVQNNLEKC